MSDSNPDDIARASESRFYEELGQSVARSMDLDAGLADATFTAMYSSVGTDIARQLNLDAGLREALTIFQTQRAHQPRTAPALDGFADLGVEAELQEIAAFGAALPDLPAGSTDGSPRQHPLRGPGRRELLGTSTVRHRRRLRPSTARLGALLVAIAVAALVALTSMTVLEIPAGPCDTATTSQTSTGECVGVSDGSVVFSPNLTTIMGLIHTENQLVDAQLARQPGTQSVSLAALAPFPSAESEPRTSAAAGTTLHELQGAYLAQLRANHADGLDSSPLIRLLIVNTGQDNAYWPSAVKQLSTMAEPGAAQNLVGVVLLGPNLSTTSDMIGALNRSGIPTIASRVTADDLAGDSGGLLNGFASVAPSARDEATAAALALRRTAERVLLVQDVNPSDVYSSVLGSRFTAAYPDMTHTLLQPIERYDSSLSEVKSSFDRLNPTVCEQARTNPATQTTSPELTIYFAGRGADLPTLISALASRSCAQTPITVFTGDEGNDLASTLRTQAAVSNGDLPVALSRNITVQFTSPANPGAWATDPNHTTFAGTRYFTDACAQCYPTLFPGESLDDGAAIMGHDAVLTAVVAIRGLVDQHNPALSIDDDAAVLAQQLYQLHDSRAVPGASGRISLDERGDPQHKPIPIVQLHPDGTVAFVELATGQ